MNDDKNKILKALHDLVASCNDAAEGYAKAAKGIHDTELSDWLAQVSDTRQRFAAELTGIIEQIGGAPRSDLHEGGILHRGWVDLEQALRPKNQNEIVQECVNGDSGTLKHYDHALAQDLPQSARPVVEKQRAEVERDISALQGAGYRQRTQHA